MNIVSFDTPSDLARAQADAMMQAPPGLILVSGGSTPKAAFELLAATPNSLGPHHQVLLCDERVVPLADERNNAGWIKPLLVKAGLPEHQFIYIDTDLPEENALTKFQQDLTRLETDIPHWGDAFLGMGADGHTCGLFSLDTADREDALALATDRADGLRGISVTRNILHHFDHCVVTVCGEGKAEMVKQFHVAPDEVITGRALKGHSCVELWGDSAALSKL